MAELTCGACGRRFTFKPEYAGKTLKCKCGQPIKAPSAAGATTTARQAVPAAPAAAPAPAAAAVAPSGGDDFSKLFADAEAEYEMAPPPPPSAVQKPPIARTAPASAARSSAMLAYAGTVRNPVAAAEETASVTNVFIPLGLLLAGLATYFLDARLIGITNPAVDAGFVLVKSVINLALVFTAILIGVKLIDLGLGAIGPALLKIAAVALLPAAVGEVLIPVNLLLAWVAPIILYFGLMKFLFDMDLSEILIVTGILWVVQTWVSMFLVGMLFASMGIGSGAAGRSFAVAAIVRPSEGKSVSDDATKTPAEIDSFAQAAIADNKAFEAHDWLGVANRNHVGLGMSQSQLRQLVDQFVIAGAKKIYTTSIETEDGEEFCTKLIVEMPDDPGKRSAALFTRDRFEDRDTPSTDGGGKYITVAIIVKKPGR